MSLHRILQLAILALLFEQILSKCYIYKDPRTQKTRLKCAEDYPIDENDPEYMCKPGRVYDMSRGTCIKPSRRLGNWLGISPLVVYKPGRCPLGQVYDTVRGFCVPIRKFPKNFND